MTFKIRLLCKMHVYNKDSPENSKVVVVNGRNMAVAFYRKNF